MSIDDAGKDFDEQPGCSLMVRPAENRDLHTTEQQPDSSEDLEQDDKPEVDPDSPENVEVTCIDDEVVPEDELDDDAEAPLVEVILEQPELESTTKSKCETEFIDYNYSGQLYNNC